MHALANLSTALPEDGRWTPRPGTLGHVASPLPVKSL